MYISSNHLKKTFGILVFCEMFLFGSGQVLQLYGGLTLKMLNYVLMLVIALLLSLSHHKIKRDTIELLVLYCVVISVASLLSAINGGLEYSFLDISPLSYFLVILFFDLYIRKTSDIKFVIRILKISTVALAIFYLIYIALINLEILNFKIVYILLENTSDIMFRGDSGAFFYKGFIYLAIGLIFYIVDGKLLSWQVLILLLAIYFTHTRAFLIIAACSYLFYYIYWVYSHHYRIPIKHIVIFAMLLFVFSLYASNLYSGFVGEDRTGGDIIRIQTMKEVVERVNIFSLFLGHGFGIGVPTREVHMEISYLEIFHKQGILGLLFWAYILIKSLLVFMKSPMLLQSKQLPFFLSILIIYIQSLFNPYLNNPIGMGFVIISYISLRELSKSKPIKSVYEN